MKNKKTGFQVIVDILRHEDLRAAEITKKTRNNGKALPIQDVASMLAKIFFKTDMGHLMIRSKTPHGYRYHIHPLAVKLLTAEQMYGLMRKTGIDKYTLEQAVKDHPELKAFVEGSSLDEQAKVQPPPEQHRTTPKSESEAISKPISVRIPGSDIELHMGITQAVSFCQDLKTAINAHL